MVAKFQVKILKFVPNVEECTDMGLLGGNMAPLLPTPDFTSSRVDCLHINIKTF
jgi:hypothetical protein